MSQNGQYNHAFKLDSELENFASEPTSKYGTIISQHDENDTKELSCKEKVETNLKGENYVNDESSNRDGWSNQIEFIFCTVSYAVGLGNVWRFPYLVYKNGGGSFLIPYFTSLVCIGFPMFFLELVLGQFSGQGPATLFGKICPLFSGLGWAMLSATVFVSLYYNVIIAWTLFYIFEGFAAELPWSSCSNLSSYHCHENFTNQTIEDNFAVGPAEDFFLHQMLNIDKMVHSWDNYGHLEWKMALCLLGAWTIICLCLIKGVQSAGKVVYFTSTFPYLVLIIFFIYGWTLDGAEEGIQYYITPNYDKLLDINVWTDAAAQIFYSLGVSFGTLTTLSSYNKFDNNCHRDALLVGCINCFTSFFAGFPVFAILGFMAKSTGQEIEEVVQSGAALVFIAIPQACTFMPIPQIWSFLFFSMLLTLGVGTMIAMVETLTTVIIDRFSLSKSKHYVSILVCLFMFVGGLSMCFNGGLYMFDLLDNVSASWNIMLCALIEVVMVSWLYGITNFLNDIKTMGIKIPKVLEFYWRFCWRLVTPISILFLIIMQFVQFEPYQYGSYIYPIGIQILAWLIPSTSVVIILLIAIYQIGFIRGRGSDLIMVLRPSCEWGPQNGNQK